VGVEDVGHGVEGELRAGDADEFGHDKADRREHGLPAVLELRLAEPVEPFGSPLGGCGGGGGVVFVSCIIVKEKRSK
jgi:hypothetical protein